MECKLRMAALDKFFQIDVQIRIEERHSVFRHRGGPGIDFSQYALIIEEPVGCIQPGAIHARRGILGQEPFVHRKSGKAFQDGQSAVETADIFVVASIKAQIVLHDLGAGLVER